MAYWTPCNAALGFLRSMSCSIISPCHAQEQIMLGPLSQELIIWISKILMHVLVIAALFMKIWTIFSIWKACALISFLSSHRG